MSDIAHIQRQLHELRQELHGFMPKVTEHDDGHLHSQSRIEFVPTEGDVLTASVPPRLVVVTGTPPSLWLVHENGRLKLGYSDEQRCTADVTLSDTNWTDVTGCSITVPNAGTYLVVATLNYDFVSGTGTTVRGRVLVDGVAQEGIIEQLPVDVGTHTGSQVWQITTDADDEVVKLQAQRSAGTANHIINDTDTKIVIFGFLGGAETAATHQHGHDALTNVLGSQHHSSAAIVDADSDTALEVERTADEDVGYGSAGSPKTDVFQWDSTKFEALKFLGIQTPPENVTISSGNAVATKSTVALSPEGGVDDSLSSIQGQTGGILLVYNASATAKITLKHNDLTEGVAGWRFLFGDGLDRVLDGLGAAILFFQIGNFWVPSAISHKIPDTHISFGDEPEAGIRNNNAVTYTAFVQVSQQ